jgi:phosphatidylglycerophosphatase A
MSNTPLLGETAPSVVASDDPVNSSTGREAQVPTAPGTMASATQVADRSGTTTPRSLPRPSVRFMLHHPAHLLALGLGSGLSPKAPGTVGTLWAWMSFLVLDPYLTDTGWATTLVLATLLGLWACTRTAQHLNMGDPGVIVWDEVVAFWLVLWVVGGGWVMQLLAFALFRYFDAAKPGPVGWADQLYKPEPGQALGWRQGWGILFDDLVAASCTLFVLAVGARLWS